MPTGTVESIHRMLLWALEGRVRRWDYIQIRARTKGVSPGSPRPCQATTRVCSRLEFRVLGASFGVQAVPGGSAGTQELGARVG